MINSQFLARNSKKIKLKPKLGEENIRGSAKTLTEL
jgi:hypothetical protein